MPGKWQGDVSSNYNHLYYFWMVCKQGSVTKAADALFLAPQTVTGQIRALEERLKGKLTKRVGRNIEPTELGQLVFKYADKMFDLSYEMLDIVNYTQRENLLLEVGVADALSKRLVSKVLMERCRKTSVFIFAVTSLPTKCCSSSCHSTSSI